MSCCKRTTALSVILIDAHFILISTFTHITCQATVCMHKRVRIVLCLYNLLVRTYVILVINKLLYFNQHCIVFSCWSVFINNFSKIDIDVDIFVCVSSRYFYYTLF